MYLRQGCNLCTFGLTQSTGIRKKRRALKLLSVHRRSLQLLSLQRRSLQLLSLQRRVPYLVA